VVWGSETRPGGLKLQGDRSPQAVRFSLLQKPGLCSTTRRASAAAPMPQPSPQERKEPSSGSPRITPRTPTPRLYSSGQLRIDVGDQTFRQLAPHAIERQIDSRQTPGWGTAPSSGAWEALLLVAQLGECDTSGPDDSRWLERKAAITAGRCFTSRTDRWSRPLLIGVATRSAYFVPLRTERGHERLVGRGQLLLEEVNELGVEKVVLHRNQCVSSARG